MTNYELIMIMHSYILWAPKTVDVTNAQTSGWLVR